MSNIEDVQKLRDMTSAGVVDCKKALEEADGDIEKAKEIIHEKGIMKVEKREGRETGAGLLYSYIHNERIGVLLEIRAETDFVVRSEPFQELAHEIAMQVAAMPADNVEELLQQLYIRDEEKTVEDIINEVIAKTGENVTLKRFCRMSV